MLFHLHMEKTGGKSIEFNVESAIGSRCYRVSRKFQETGIHRNFDHEDPSVFKNVDGNSMVTGHYYFGLHKYFEVENPVYVSLLREPVARMKSLYNYILNSPMTIWKEIVLKNKLSFSDFALGNFEDATTDEVLRFVIKNGQSKLLGQWDEKQTDSGALLENAMRNIESVEYNLFPSENSTEAYCFIMRHLGQSILRRYVRVNVCPYDHVGSVSEELVAEINNYNSADFALYQLAKESFHRRKDLSTLLRMGQITRSIEKVELAAKEYLPLGVLAKFRKKIEIDSRYKSAGVMIDEDGNCYIADPYQNADRRFYILPQDRKGLRYAQKTDWDDTPHRIWRAAASVSDVLVDVGSNYGEFLVCLDGLDCDGLNIFSLEANAQVADCQIRTISQFSFANRIVVQKAAASSKSGSAEFLVNKADTGSSSLISVEGKTTRETVPLVTVDNIIKESGVSALSVSLKIDVEGHDIEVLKGAFETLRASSRFLVTLELSMNQWNELMECLDEARIFSSLRYYAYAWNNLFKVDRNFSLGEGYKGNIDFYVTNMPEVESEIQFYAVDFKPRSVRSH